MARPLRRRKGFFVRWVWSYPGSRKPRPLAMDECANFWPGCRPAWALVRCHALCPWGSTLQGRRIERLEIGEPFRVGDRSVSQE